MRAGRIAVTLAGLFLFGDEVDAFWRMPCRARSGLARIDPLVSNGTVSEHAHAIHGSDGKPLRALLSSPSSIFGPVEFANMTWSLPLFCIFEPVKISNMTRSL